MSRRGGKGALGKKVTVSLMGDEGCISMGVAGPDKFRCWELEMIYLYDLCREEPKVREKIS